MRVHPKKVRHRLLVPEVVQTSAMDCGPATLKCLLEGFGISVSYGRLREACQTDVDGTSIDTMEEIAVQLGLEAEQIMTPVDHLTLPEAQTLPAIVVVRLPSGVTHFVQVMDPGTGRRWMNRDRFLSDVYIHTFPVPAADWRELGLTGQCLGAISALVIFVAVLLLLELPIATGMRRFGRHLEIRLRRAFLEKLPRIGDRYFHSRLISDMAERSHSIYRIRLLSSLGGRLIRLTFELILTTAGIIWLHPASAPLAVLVGVLGVAIPLVMQPFLVERDLRVRTHQGALSRFYLDSLLGLVAVRTHGAERAVRREHESLLVEWTRASFGLLQTTVGIQGILSFMGFGLTVWLILNYLTGAAINSMLLLVYWGLNLPVLGEEIARIIRQYPAYRNLTLRLLEPLGAPEESGVQANE